MGVLCLPRRTLGMITLGDIWKGLAEGPQVVHDMYLWVWEAGKDFTERV